MGLLCLKVTIVVNYSDISVSVTLPRFNSCSSGTSAISSSRPAF